MCEISSTKSKIKSGYKVLAIKDDKFYSTFTGQELNCGIVPKAPEKCNRLSVNWASVIESPTWKTHPLYNPKFDGMTASFVERQDAIHLFMSLKQLGILLWDYSLCVVYITYKGTVYEGNYGRTTVIAGRHIKTIEKIRGI